MKKKKLAGNINTLKSLSKCPVVAFVYAANRTVRRITKVYDAFVDEMKEDKSPELITLEKEISKIRSESKTEEEFQSLLELWKKFDRYVELNAAYLESKEYELLINEEVEVNVFKHNLKKEYLIDWKPNDTQLDALEIICPNFEEFFDELFSLESEKNPEQEPKPKPAKK